MFVCLCQNVTDGDIRRTMREKGLSTLREVREELAVASQCGRCARCARQVIAEELAFQRGAEQAASAGGRACIPIAVAA